MINIALEREIYKEMLSVWEQFLLSREISWQVRLTGKSIPSELRSVRLTIGRFLFSDYFLSMRELFEHTDDILLQADLQNYRNLKNKWLTNWQLKINKEIPIRMREWERIVNDLRSDSDYSQTQLKNQLLIRVILDLLINELNLDDQLIFTKNVNELDVRYIAVTHKKQFIWNKEFEEYFPEEKFWYLYRYVSHSGGD